MLKDAHMNQFSKAEIDRFNRRFDRAGGDECWEWKWHANPHGHGRMWASGRHTLASHIALAIDGRPRPEGKCALHSCDNPPCVNPSHLRWGTQLENIGDRVARDRNGFAAGERNGASKLTWDCVDRIRADTRSSRYAAEEYGVSRVMICNIKSGRAWTHDPRLDP